MRVSAKICSDRLRRKQRTRSQKVQETKNLSPTTAGSGTPQAKRAVEEVPVELRLVVAEVDTRHPAGVLVAGTRAVHVVLGEHVGVNAEGDAFVGRETGSFLLLDESFRFLGRLAEHVFAVLDVEHEVGSFGHVNDVADIGLIEVVIPLTVTVANHLHQIAEIDFRSRNYRDERDVAVGRFDFRCFGDDFALLAGEHVDDALRATTCLQGFHLRVEQLAERASHEFRPDLLRGFFNRPLNGFQFLTLKQGHQFGYQFFCHGETSFCVLVYVYVLLNCSLLYLNTILQYND